MLLCLLTPPEVCESSAAAGPRLMTPECPHVQVLAVVLAIAVDAGDEQVRCLGCLHAAGVGGARLRGGRPRAALHVNHLLGGLPWWQTRQSGALLPALWLIASSVSSAVTAAPPESRDDVKAAVVRGDAVAEVT